MPRLFNNIFNHNMLMYDNFVLEILPHSCLAEVFGGQTELKQKIPKLEWMIRYLTHVKCRGVLASKGYIVCLKR